MCVGCACMEILRHLIEQPSASEDLVWGGGRGLQPIPRGYRGMTVVCSFLIFHSVCYIGFVKKLTTFLFLYAMKDLK